MTRSEPKRGRMRVDTPTPEELDRRLDALLPEPSDPTFALPDGRLLAVGSDATDYTSVVLCVSPDGTRECWVPGAIRRALWDALDDAQKLALIDWLWGHGVEVVSVYRDEHDAEGIARYQQAVLMPEREQTRAGAMGRRLLELEAS